MKHPKSKSLPLLPLLGAVGILLLIVVIFAQAKWNVLGNLSAMMQGANLTQEYSQVTAWDASSGTAGTTGENLPSNEDFLQIEDAALHFAKQDLDTLGNLKEKIALLERAYSYQKSFETAELLLDAYQLDHQYTQARKLYYQLPEAFQKKLKPDPEFKIFLNSFSLASAPEYQHLKELFDRLIEQKVREDEEVAYYQSLFALAEGDYDGAKKLLAQLQSDKFAAYCSKVQAAFAQYQQLKDVPTYYQDGLIALQLMDEGRYVLAKKVALPLVTQYPSYILPYQVLANADFVLGRQESAISYFQQLLKLDYQQKNNYLYHLGVLNYQLGKYSEAVIFFSQITDHKVTLDGDRYLVLSYLALGEENKAIVSWQRLLDYPNLKKSDFYSFFEEALRKPYRKGQSASYLAKDAKLVKGFLSLCKKRLNEADQAICSYGELGYQVHTAESKTVLYPEVLPLAKKYQHPELHQLLAEIFAIKGHTARAQEEYMQALSLVKTHEEWAFLRQSILQLTEQAD